MVKNFLRWMASRKQFLAYVSLSITCLLIATHADAQTIGDVAGTVTQSFKNLAKLITATAYVAGMGFAIGAILKFKQHKDNPTQIPVGTPVALLFISAALIFLPSIFSVAGATLFGSSAQVGKPSGIIFTGPE